LINPPRASLYFTVIIDGGEWWGGEGELGKVISQHGFLFTLHPLCRTHNRCSSFWIRAIVLATPYKTSLPRCVTKFKRRNEFYSANLIILFHSVVENDDNSFSSSIVLPYSGTVYIRKYFSCPVHAHAHTPRPFYISINHKHLFKRVCFPLHSPGRHSPFSRMKQYLFLFFIFW